MNSRTTDVKLDALSKLARRAEDVKAALKEVQARRRNQEKVDRLRLEALIGSAMLADAEADADSGGGRRTYISQILDRQITSPIARAFLAVKGWL
jgi:hypothetical protein